MVDCHGFNGPGLDSRTSVRGPGRRQLWHASYIDNLAVHMGKKEHGLYGAFPTTGTTNKIHWICT